MGPLQSVASCMRQFARFRGRAPRLEYFWFNLFVILCSFGGIYLDSSLLGPELLETLGFFGPVGLILFLILFLPSLSVAVRRFHDFNASGLWAIFLLIPIVNLILILFLLFPGGDAGANRFGEPPRA